MKTKKKATKKTRKHTRATADVAPPPTFAERTSAIDDASGFMGIQLVIQRARERILLSFCARGLAAASRPRARTRAASLLAPVESGVVEVEIGATRHVVDASTWLVIPRGSRAIVIAKSPTTKTLILDVSDSLVDKAIATYKGEIDPSSFKRYLGAVQLLPRTTWINELCHRYLFERAVCKKSNNDATRFLETELAKEAYFVCRDRDEGQGHARPSVVEKTSPLIERAMTFVTEHLFEPDVLARVSRACGASQSTLLRAFKREVGQAPLAYVRQRRLDESLLLLKAQRLSVGEIAALVGYKNLAAFSQAFRARFGKKPSEIRRAK